MISFLLVKQNFLLGYYYPRRWIHCAMDILSTWTTTLLETWISSVVFWLDLGWIWLRMTKSWIKQRNSEISTFWYQSLPCSRNHIISFQLFSNEVASKSIHKFRMSSLWMYFWFILAENEGRIKQLVNLSKMKNTVG